MRKLNKIILPILLMLFCLTGCDFHKNELKERLIIEGIGVDISEGGFVVTLEVLDTQAKGSSGSSGSSSDKEMTKLYTGKGRSIAQAINDIISQTGQKPLYSHVWTIVLGSEAAESGIREILDFFVRGHNTRSNVMIAVCESQASELFSANIGKSMIRSQVISEIMDAGKIDATTDPIELYQLINRLDDDTSAAYIPIINLIDNEESPDIKSYEAGDFAVFRQNVRTGIIPKKNIRGLLWLNDAVDAGVFTVSDSYGATASLSIVRSSTKIKTSFADGQPTFDVQIFCTCDLIESARPNNTITLATLDEIAGFAKTEIERQTVETAYLALRILKSDVFRFGRRFWLAEPNVYSKFSGDWPDVLQNAEVTIGAHVTVRRVGQEAMEFYESETVS